MAKAVQAGVKEEGLNGELRREPMRPPVVRPTKPPISLAPPMNDGQVRTSEQEHDTRANILALIRKALGEKKRDIGLYGIS